MKRRYDDRGPVMPDLGVLGIDQASQCFERAVLTAYVRKHGPIPCARVSSASASGRPRNYSYWGAARYEIRLRRKDGALTSIPIQRAGADRQNPQLALEDCEALCEREQRVMVKFAGPLGDLDVRYVLSCLSAIGRFGQPQGGVK